MAIKKKIYDLILKKIIEPSMRRGIETGVGTRKSGRLSRFAFNKVLSPVYEKLVGGKPKLKAKILKGITAPAWKNIMTKNPGLQDQVSRSFAKGLMDQNPKMGKNMADLIADTIIKSGFLSK